MAGRSLETEAILLSARLSGEHGRLLTFFAPVHGLLTAHHRRSARGNKPVPDLFDHAGLVLEKNSGDLWFVREYRVIRRHAGLGRDYRVLTLASRFARVLENHLYDETAANALAARLPEVLRAWEQGARPDSVYLKALYLFARDEGLPVRGEWIASLSPSDREDVLNILRQSADAQTTPRPAVERLTSLLETYLSREHDIRFPPH